MHKLSLTLRNQSSRFIPQNSALWTLRRFGSAESPTVEHAPPVFSQNNSLITQYRLIPVADHPIFPGSTSSLSVTQQEYDLLKDVETVFASVVSNDSVLKQDKDLMQQLQMHVGKLPSLGLPKIKKESDIYKVGSICQSKVIHDA